MTINTLVKEADADNYAASHPVGNTFCGKTIKQVEILDAPPHPTTGEAVKLVMIHIE